MTVKELKKWMESLPKACQDSQIGIDDGGLTLVVEGYPDVYYEIGCIGDQEGHRVP